LEVIFFEMPGVLVRRLRAVAITEALIERGHYLPDETLAKLLSPSGLSKEDFFKSLTNEELEELRQGPQARKLIAAVEKLAAAAARYERIALAASQPERAKIRPLVNGRSRSPSSPARHRRRGWFRPGAAR
jgi:hypothetical protein